MHVLVIGGAGYIGSHMVKLLLDAGESVSVLDNFYSGHREAVRDAEIIAGDVGDRDLLNDLFRERRFDGVMHFASYIRVDESLTAPERYYRNNVAHTLTLLEAMSDHGLTNLIFSSSAAVFGEPQYTPVDEKHPRRPISPYGMSKLIVEQMLVDMDRAYGFKSVSLRYFNAAGADPGGWRGTWQYPPLHLIPMILRTASGRYPQVKVFGNDYDTPDGTCIRDYVHVVDLCQAHLLALDYLRSDGGTDAFNLGNGSGFSVRQVIETVQKVTGRTFAVHEAPRRPGDPARLVADASRARTILGWSPQYPHLEQIVQHAWKRELQKA